jgi:hypothetical protein
MHVTPEDVTDLLLVTVRTPPSSEQGVKVSVVSAARNAAATLPDALHSLQAQTLQDWEAIVVDDGSTDETAAVAADIAARDRRIRVLQQPWAGVAAARNAGLLAARADWLLFLDADDWLLPTALEQLVAAIEADSHLGAVYGGWTRVNAEGEVPNPGTLVTLEVQHAVEIGLPSGRRVSFPVESCRIAADTGQRAEAVVVKDAGDDPDVTDGAHLTASVSWRGQAGLELDGGVGVGVVTKPGLGLALGGPAINPVPRKMITEAPARRRLVPTSNNLSEANWMRITSPSSRTSAPGMLNGTMNGIWRSRVGRRSGKSPGRALPLPLPAFPAGRGRSRS